MSKASKVPVIDDAVYKAMYGVFLEKMRGETPASLHSLVARGEALLTRRKELDASGPIRKSDLLDAFLRAAKEEIASRRGVSPNVNRERPLPRRRK